MIRIYIAVFFVCVFFSTLSFGKRFHCEEGNVQTFQANPDTVKNRPKFFKRKKNLKKASQKKQEAFVCQLPPSVIALELDKLEIIEKCSVSKNCSSNEKTVNVTVVAVEPEHSKLIYSYTVSDGKVIGEGSKVVWDLTGVKPGNYKITAAVDDERTPCIFCGQPKTKEIAIKECLDCKDK